MIIRTVKSPISTARHDRFEVAESWLDRIAVLSIRHSVDMLSAPRLSAAISAALAKGPVALVVDMTDVEFLGSAGMSVLVEAQDQATTASALFGVVADGAATSRPIKLLGIDAILALYPTLGDALSDMR
jgi:anti-anti-sigma factor